MMNVFMENLSIDRFGITIKKPYDFIKMFLIELSVTILVLL